jgi:hypothetical protein
MPPVVVRVPSLSSRYESDDVAATWTENDLTDNTGSRIGEIPQTLSTGVGIAYGEDDGHIALIRGPMGDIPMSLFVTGRHSSDHQQQSSLTFPSGVLTMTSS